MPPASAASLRRTPSAIGDRQVLAVQTKRILVGSLIKVRDFDEC